MSEKSDLILEKIIKSRELFKSKDFWGNADDKCIIKAKKFVLSVDKYVRDLTNCINGGHITRDNVAMICIFTSKDRMARAREINLPFRPRNILSSYARNSFVYVIEINKNNRKLS